MLGSWELLGAGKGPRGGGGGGQRGGVDRPAGWHLRSRRKLSCEMSLIPTSLSSGGGGAEELYTEADLPWKGVDRSETQSTNRISQYVGPALKVGCGGHEPSTLDPQMGSLLTR